MRQVFIKREGSTVLHLFFAGWGADEHLFAEAESEADLLLCCDYRTPDFDVKLLSGYTEIRLTAWSLGVWMAEHTLASCQLPITEATAINGTPFPIDEQRGIAPAIFGGTLTGMDDRTLVKFRRRMCSQNYTYFMQHLPQRSVADLKEELVALKKQIENAEPLVFHWNTAVIGTNDRIFVPQNQLAAWQGRADRLLQVEAEHYDPKLFVWKKLS